MIPSGTTYPEVLDTDDNLFVVHDSLRAVLIEDYNPGDTSITVSADPGVMDRFPPTGIITLTEQCNEPEVRGTSFYYGSHTDTTFDSLEIMPNFEDVTKLKGFTNVTMNVYADHHNSIKDALIAIEEFVGVKGQIDVLPYGDTLTGRLNFLRRLVLTPRAWFTADKTIGIVPATVNFTDVSFRYPTSWVWDFGDGGGVISGPSISGISVSTSPTPTLTPIAVGAVPCATLQDPSEDDRRATHTYFTPGKYDVTLTVGNPFGRDTVTLPEFFTARAPAPDEASFLVAPTKVRTDTVVNIEATDNGEQTEDPVVEYTWILNDDLTHQSAPLTTALYSVGGIYDVVLRVDTELGAYRITTLEDAVNVVEQTNLWLLAFDSPKGTLSITKNLRTYEFGLTSETFKSEVMPELSVTRDYSFMSGYPNQTYQRDIFLRNAGLAPKGLTASGDRGQAILSWAEDSSTIRYKQFEPFNETWSSAGLAIGETQTKFWNWFTFSSPDAIYIIFGHDTITGSPTDISLERFRHNLSTLTTTTSTYDASNFINGADELLTYADSAPATYRGCFQGENGFFARNDAGPGGFFRIRNFYRTEGTLSDVATDVRKLLDIAGTARTEMEMVPLSGGVYVFNNSGEVSAYDPNTNVWTSGGPGVGAASFRSLQDANIDGYADTSQTLRAASDGDRRAYLSYDYSANAFIKFNEIDLTFSSLGSRPTSNEQFIMTVF